MEQSDTMSWRIAAPIDTWDEALPLGNGITGVLLWGNSRQLKLSLDRGDLWDERVGTVYQAPDWNRRALEEIVAGGDRERFARLEQLPLQIQATKLPVGRIEIDFPVETGAREFFLDLPAATGKVLGREGATLLECFCASDMSGIYLRVAEPEQASLRIVPPDYHCTASKPDQAFVKDAASLGYPEPIVFVSERLQYYVQPCVEGLHYGIFVVRSGYNTWNIFVRRADSAAEMDSIIDFYQNPETCYPSYDEEHEIHRAWWADFWKRSDISLNDADVTRYYHLCRYFYGSASRIGAPPMPLQGVWTAADNTLPPWKGDYHHDLNTEMNYIAYLTSGDFDCGESFLNHLAGQINVYKEFARSFFGVDGVAVPGTATLSGQALGGWMQYSMSPTNSAWLATMFTDHYRYTLDRDFLIYKAVPFVFGVGTFILNLLRVDSKGKFFLPLSTSPEIHDGELEAFLTPTSNYDLALVKRLFFDLKFLCRELKDERGEQEWEERLKLLPDFSIDPEAGLMLSPDEVLQESHRHHSHMMAIYPLRLLNMEKDAELIRKTFLHLDKLGSGMWVGFGFAWAGAMGACCGNAGRAYRMLKIFLDGFISRNGFHLNGDYKDYGYCWWKYRPFTMETNFLAMQIIHEMLLQSFNGQYRIFPAVPPEWPEVEFRDLRGESGVSVSAKMSAGRIKFIRLHATRDCCIQVYNPARNGETLVGSRGECWTENQALEVNLKAGEELCFVDNGSVPDKEPRREEIRCGSSGMEGNSK